MSEVERQDVTTSPIDRLDGSTFLSLQHNITNLTQESAAYVKLSSEHIRHLSDLLRILRASLLHDEDFAKETFRSLGGFEAVIGTLQAFSGCCTRCDDVNGIRSDLIDLLTAVVDLVSSAVSNNIVNRRCFGKETHDSGWTDFGEAILATGVFGDKESHEKVFGLLFSLCLLDDDLKSLFRRLRLRLDGTEVGVGFGDISTATISAFLAQALDSDTIWCPKMVSIIIKGWRACYETDSTNTLVQHVILALVQMCIASKHNLVAIHNSDIIDILLEQLARSDQDHTLTTSTTLLLSSLLRMGLPDPSKARLLLRLAETNPNLRRICSEAKSITSTPPAFHFDLRLGGYAAIQLTDIGASFPSQLHGYTLSTWLQVESYDTNCHTIIFGLAETFLVYIDSETRHLNLQTSTNNKMVFKQFLFEIGVEYHIVIIHNTAQQSTLFVNGAPVDDLQCPYPATMLSPRAFIGTPYDHAALIGHNVLKSRWCLLSLHLFDVPLTPEAVFIHYKLSYRYSGNYQDGLGPFFNYSSSAELMLIDEYKRQKHDKNSKHSLREIARTKRLRSNLVLAVNTSVYFNHDDNVSKLLLKTEAAMDIMSHHLSGTLHGLGCIVNSAFTHLQAAMPDHARLGYLTDGVTAFRPHYWPDTLWQLTGGTSLLLSQVAKAETVTIMVQEIRAIFDMLDCSWRLSEAFERDNAYAVLSWLFRVKVGNVLLQHDVSHIALLAPQTSCADLLPELLLLILEFVGIDFKNPKSCLIKNMLAYRMLVLDCGLWSQLQCQQVFYHQFIILLDGNRFSAFNAKRLSKLRMMQKLLDNLKSATVNREVIPTCKTAISVLLKHLATADILRITALFVTSTLQKVSHGDTADVLHDQNDELVVGSLVLDAFTDYLCVAGPVDGTEIFAKSVTNKWLLHLFDSADATTVCSTIRIIVHLIVTEGPRYSDSFETKQGYCIMRAKLSRWHVIPFVWAALFGLLLGIDVGPLAPSSFQLNTFFKTITKRELVVSYPSAWYVLAGLFKQSFADCSSSALIPEQLTASLAFLQVLLKRSQSFALLAETSSFTRDVFYLLFNSGEEKLEHEQPLDTTTKKPIDLASVKGQSNNLEYVRPLLVDLTQLDNNMSQPHYTSAIDVLTAVFTKQILNNKDFAGIGLFFKAPKTTLDMISARSTVVMRAILHRLAAEFAQCPSIYHEPVCLSNLARFVKQSKEAVLEGWVADISFGLLHFLANLLMYLNDPGIRDLKIVRLCSATIDSTNEVFKSLAIFQLARLQDLKNLRSKLNFIMWMIRWKHILLSRGTTDDTHLDVLFYLVYQQTCSTNEVELKKGLVSLWSAWIRSEPTRSLQVLSGRKKDNNPGHELFAKLNNEPTIALEYLTDHTIELGSTLLRCLGPPFERFLEQQNQTIATTTIARTEKRAMRLHQRDLDILAAEHAVLEHESRSEPWRRNIHESEYAKWQRARQDQQDNDSFMQLKFSELDAQLVGLDLFEKRSRKTIWGVDNAEGYERRKIRLRPVQPSKVVAYVPKRTRAASATLSNLALRPTQSRSTSRTQTPHANTTLDARINLPLAQGDGIGSLDDYEVVPLPEDADSEFLDINRKVMRSLQRGERILEVYNVTRIKGLEAVFSLLIVGNKSLYLLDNLFQKSDGEVVSADQAPKDEKDQYIVNILGSKTADNVDTRAELAKSKDARHWAWAHITNISKRRFLLRDVAIELFFVDGRSYLITTLTAANREILYTSLQGRVSAKAELSLTFRWRADQFAMSDLRARSVGSRIFNLGPNNPATALWVRGELSNFQYLMLVNTQAGRTTTDLTQYPVFPWILRDYTSSTLDLDDVLVYRDLSKPMGAQSPEREATYRDRYDAFAEMNDFETPAFHYGTHYSSAMIVTSYLIRLEPFVRSYILQQGGAFDHPERLFDSIERTWLSASQETVADVRELTPEFYFMPEFLTNINGYDFGTKESTGETVNDVVLPPWAKNDPKIFIAKQREALESPYVSEHLHTWIDLVFGYKQQGAAAIEATNVFHHLSYHGAKNLDEIEDPREQLSTTMIIHSFGQTPTQVFQKPHLSRQTATEKIKPLSTYFTSLDQVQEPLIKDAQSQISNLSLSLGTQRLTHSGPFQTHRPPKYHVYVEWGNTDGSLRFYKAEGKLLDLFEALHTDNITVAAFADETTLVTASLDCTVTIWNVDGPSSGPFDVHFTAGLYGHIAPVNVLVVSRTLSTILSSSTDSKVILWDLNSHERLRVLENKEEVDYAQIDDSSGHILLCSGMIAKLYTINGELILQQNLCAGLDDKITSCAFYATSSNEWLGGEYILTGHTQGMAKIWRLANTLEGFWRLELVKTLTYGESSRPSTSLGGRLVSRSGRDTVDNTAARRPAITCVYAYNRRVFTGDDAGEVYEWTTR